MLKPFTYERAESLRQAVKALAKPGARLHAGGTDLLGCLRDGVFDAERVVSISGIGELKGITALAEGGLRIGALATLTEIAENKLVRDSYAVLAEAAASAASPQLRNQGTLGGNLCQRPRCWYFRGDFHCLRKGGDACFAEAGENDYHAIFGGHGCFMVHPSDTAPALVALGASAHIAGPKGSRTVPLGEFFVLPQVSVTRENVLEPGEILTEVLLPPAAPGTRGTYRKVRERGAWDFAIAGAAVVLETGEGGAIRSARIVLSAAAAIPWRALEAERAIEGRKLDRATIASAASAAVIGAQPLEKNAYKAVLFQGVLEETLEKLAG
jgi:xanthine dehydrogenase YagS FAD-binding subunit